MVVVDLLGKVLYDLHGDDGDDDDRGVGLRDKDLYVLLDILDMFRVVVRRLQRMVESILD
jgi:hypothetical protein